MLNSMVERIRSAHSVVLSTHRHCDGDGLGAQLALLFALKKLGKDVRVLNVDRPAKRYAFLGTHQHVSVFPDDVGPELPSVDLALIFDTNDGRLVEPLYSAMVAKCKSVLFVDHHPVLAHGPLPTEGSLIDVSAASTGELAYRLIKALGVSLDEEIARALYTSVVFDTQLFRYVRSDPASHLMAADLLKFEKKPEEVHQKLFATYTVEKLKFLAGALGAIEYHAFNRVAFIHLTAEDLSSSHLDLDESGDVIDIMMDIGSVEAAALLREDGPERFKLSLRSKGKVEVLAIAESFGGGGHKHAAGAYPTGSYDMLRRKIIDALVDLVRLQGQGGRE